MKIKVLFFCIVLSITLLFSQSSGVKIGDNAPEISAKDLHGNQIKLSAFKDKVIVLRFWQKGCYQCTIDMPKLQELQNEYKDEFVVIAINSDNPIKEIKIFKDENKINYLLLKDDMDISRKKYAIVTVPTMFVIGTDGKIKEKILGSMPWYKSKIAILRHLQNTQQ